MLTLDGLVIRVEDFTLAADFEVPQGALCAVLGPSGAGKSTLLSCIAGFLAPASGKALWQGQVISALPPARRPVSVLFQDGNLFPHLTAAQNVGLGLRPDLRLASADEAKIAAALARVGLEGMGGRKPGQLSGGQNARVALARVLLRDRPVLLLDEPFGALGPALKAEMLELVRDLACETGATVLMVSHEPGDAKAIADRVILVSDGVAAPPAATAEIFANPPAAMAAYLG